MTATVIARTKGYAAAGTANARVRANKYSVISSI